MFNKLKKLLEDGVRSIPQAGSAVVNRVNNYVQPVKSFVQNDVVKPVSSFVNSSRLQQTFKNTLPTPANFNKFVTKPVTDFALNSPKLNFVDKMAQKPVIKTASNFGHTVVDPVVNYGKGAAYALKPERVTNLIMANSKNPVYRDYGQNKLLEDKPAPVTPKQMLANTAQTMLTVAPLKGTNLGSEALSGLSKTAPNVIQAAKLANTARAAKYAEVGINTAKNAAVGAGFMGAQAYGENKSSKEIAKSAGEGALFGGGLSLGGEGLAAGIGKIAEKMNLRKAINSIIHTGAELNPNELKNINPRWNFKPAWSKIENLSPQIDPNKLDRSRVDFYKKKIANGEKIEPIVTMNDGKLNAIADGDHRLQALKEMGATQAPTFEGTPRPSFGMTTIEVPKVPKNSSEVLSNEAKIISPELLNTKHASDVFAELDTASAGKRYFVDNDKSMSKDVIGQPSSFPKWIPEELRTTPLVNKVKESLLNGTRPTGKAGELYDITKLEMQKRDPLNFLNKENMPNTNPQIPQAGNATAPISSPETLVQNKLNKQKTGQPVVSEGIPQTNPGVQTPIELNQKSSSQLQSTPSLVGSQEQPSTKIDIVPNLTRSGGVWQIPLEPEVNVPVKIKALGDVSPESIKDISGIDSSFKNVYRNFEKAFGDRFADIKRRVLDPFDRAKGQMVVEQENLAQSLKNDIVDGLGIKKGSKESALVQQFGEGKITLDELKNEVGEVKAQNIVNADNWFRSQYDRLLDEVNAVRAKIYPNNPSKQIPKRPDYYRHFQELDGFEGLKNMFDTPAGIPAEMSAISYQTKPNTKFLSFAQKRTGDKTKYDAVGGFINYMRSATYAKNIDPQIKVFRNLSKEIIDTGINAGETSTGTNFVRYLNRFADDLSGKTNAGDVWLQDTFGRGTMKAINWLNSRVKANVILGNLSSAVAQAGNTPQMMAHAGYKNWAKGFMDVLNPGNRVINDSNFIKERYSNSIFDQFDTKLLDQPKKAAVWITQALDELSTKIGWNGFYQQAVEKGITNPVQYADDLTRSMVGGRGIGEVPLAQKSKAMQLVAPFMLEVQNLMQVLGKDVAKKDIGVIIKYALAAYGFNKAAEVIRGNGVTFDPIQAVVDATKAYQEEDNKGFGALRAGGRLAGEVLSNTMGGQQIASIYPEYGFKIGGKSLTRKQLFGKEDPTRFGTGIAGVLTSGIQDPLYKVLPPFGGSQLEKTIQGAKSFAKGYAENSSKKVQYAIDQTPINLAKSLAFGKYATGQARDYFNKGGNPLSDVQSEIFKSGGGKDFYNKTISDRIAEANSKKQIEQFKSGKTKVKSSVTTSTNSDIMPLSNGKFYSKSLDKSFNGQVQADEAINGEEFLKTGKASQVIGDKVFRKDNSERGYAITTKISYDTLLTTQKMENAKTAKDLNKWADLYKVQRENLITQLNDTSLDELEKGDLQQKLDKLDADAAKYAGYGGFTKGKAAKKFTIPSNNVALSSAGSTYKYLQSLLSGTKEKPSTSQQIGRKITLRKQQMKG